MTGPLSWADVESTLHGPFFSSPLLVSVQPQALGTPDKICMCKNLSKGTKSIPSVNSHILKGSFPTCFDTTSHVANIISLLLLYFYTLIPHLLVVPVYTPYLTILPFSIVMCRLWPETRSWAKPSQKKLGLTFGLSRLLAQPGI